jgi:heme/copper-type cytochrome/quinol oxidase subunit 2
MDRSSRVSPVSAITLRKKSVHRSELTAVLNALASLPPVQLAVLVLAVVVAVAVEGLLFVDTIRARATAEGPEPSTLEVTWTLLPAVLLVALFLYSAGHLGLP